MSEEQKIEVTFSMLELRGKLLISAKKLTFGDINKAEDLIQDTMLMAFKKLHKFEYGTNLLAWLNKLQFHIFINQYRKNRRQGELRFKNDPTYLDEVVRKEDSQDPLVLLSREEISTDIIDAILKLDPKYRQVLLMNALQDMKYQEIADELDVPLGTVMSRLFRARTKLHEQLKYRDAA